ncbi:MAG: metallophosphoesterase [bacterium]|nr:metallophosphoesterase [bacterium]
MRKYTVFFAVALVLAVAAGGCSASVDWSVLPGHLAGGVVVYGDSRTGHDVHLTLVEGMATIEPAAVFHTGDLVDDGRVAGDWIIFNRIISELPSGTPVYPALGNHEEEAQRYFDNFTLPGNEKWYPVDDIEGFHFVVLDTESSLAAGSTQYQWLESELSSSVSATDYTIVTFHYPLFSTGKHRSDEKGIADDLVPLFEQYGVDAVFNGHDHDYERSTVNGIRYIVTGGGGAPLRNQAESSEFSELFLKAYHFCVLFFDEEQNLTVEVWSDKAEMIDSFGITNR